jgi:CDP-paratose 2-epimerase
MKPDLIIHAAGQPSHDWAAEHPVEDFDANARGTLNMLHLAKKHSPECVFIFTSTNKVYGDRPNTITEYQEKETRWEPFDKSCARHGFDENLSVDQCKHSLFGVSKLYADMIVQEYGRYFGMKTGVFRLGCVTGPDHAGVEQHGFLSYLFKCFREKKKYVIHGYKGKQVRDNIHSFDVAMAFKEFYNNPRPGEVYNMGGGEVNCSILEVIGLLEKISGRKMDIEYSETPRKGDHIWYVSDTRKFKKHYPEWTQAYSLSTIVEEMISRGGI